MADLRTPRLAVLIDADNVSANYAAAIFAEIAALGEASVRRIYGDWSSPHLNGWAKCVAALGLVPDQQFSNTKGKNASDIGLVIAAMDFLHSGLFDGFVLVSSDSDFTRLASRIREQGLDVYGIGEKKTPEAFRMACKRFIYVENLSMAAKDTADPDPPEPAKTPRTAEADPKAVVKPVVGQPAKEPVTKVIPLVLAAMKAIDPDKEWYPLGQLGQFITQANPDFDARTYGSAKLSDLLKRIKRFEVRPGTGNHVEVRDAS
jgi:NYN domain/OST-HTH/LOTUS domain